MKQALILVDEINRKLQAFEKTKSPYLVRDYGKSIKDDLRELKTYCKYKGINFKRLTKRIDLPKKF